MTRRRGGNQHIPRPPNWKIGSAPEWAMRDLSVLHDESEIRRRLSQHITSTVITNQHINADWVETSKRSAVLIPLLTQDSIPHVVLTRRADHMRNHKGEVSFPGGRMEVGETPAEAAVREAHEEIALPTEFVNVVGELEPIATFVSNSHITPVVAHVDGVHEFVPDPNEVARVFTVPLHELAQRDTYRNEWWETPRGDINIHFFELDDETIWGATGRLLHHLLDIVTQ